VDGHGGRTGHHELVGLSQPLDGSNGDLDALAWPEVPETYEEPGRRQYSKLRHRRTTAGGGGHGTIVRADRHGHDLAPTDQEAPYEKVPNVDAVADAQISGMCAHGVSQHVKPATPLRRSQFVGGPDDSHPCSPRQSKKLRPTKKAKNLG
jgi:hypothetical protein